MLYCRNLSLSMYSLDIIIINNITLKLRSESFVRMQWFNAIKFICVVITKSLFKLSISVTSTATPRSSLLFFSFSRQLRICQTSREIQLFRWNRITAVISSSNDAILQWNRTPTMDKTVIDQNVVGESIRFILRKLYLGIDLYASECFNHNSNL